MIWFDKLLPKSKAFRLGKNKQITEFFEALENVYLALKDFIVDIYLDIWPATTNQLDLWEVQFGLGDSTALTESQRRQRLDAAWKRNGGQSPSYIQNTLQNAGFDVWIHEWWVPGTLPPVARNPNDYVVSGFIPPECGEPLAECGEPSAECTGEYTPSLFTFIVEAGEDIAEAGEVEAEAGNYDAGAGGLGYLLVNKIYVSIDLIVNQFGDGMSQFGDVDQFGKTNGFVVSRKIYTVPDDVNTWPYFLYFGGEIFDTPAVIPSDRREEFENLLLEICPAQQWLALKIIYT